MKILIKQSGKFGLTLTHLFAQRARFVSVKFPSTRTSLEKFCRNDLYHSILIVMHQGIETMEQVLVLALRHAISKVSVNDWQVLGHWFKFRNPSYPVVQKMSLKNRKKSKNTCINYSNDRKRYWNIFLWEIKSSNLRFSHARKTFKHLI